MILTQWKGNMLFVLLDQIFYDLNIMYCNVIPNMKFILFHEGGYGTLQNDKIMQKVTAVLLRAKPH